MFDIIIGVGALIIIVGSAAYFKIKRYLELKNLTHWVHRGVPPKDVDIALQVIYDRLTNKPKRWGGIITWVDGPFFVDSIKAAGVVDSFEYPKIRLTKFDDIEKTALAHELAHVYEKLVDGDSKLYEWVNQTNTMIRLERAAHKSATIVHGSMVVAGTIQADKIAAGSIEM